MGNWGETTLLITARGPPCEGNIYDFHMVKLSTGSIFISKVLSHIREILPPFLGLFKRQVDSIFFMGLEDLPTNLP